MFLAGGGTVGTRVHGEWPGCAPEALEREGDRPLDLKVTTDYRDVLSEILVRRCGQERLDRVFPGYAYRPIGVVKA